MKNLLVALTFILTATTATAANTNVKFVKADSSTESSLCVSAAKNGLKSAMKMVREKLTYNVICNGQSLKSFSKNYNAKHKQVVKAPIKKFVVIPANENSASRVCAQAVKTGIQSVRSTVDFDVDSVICNGKSISKFVKQYNKKSS